MASDGHGGKIPGKIKDKLPVIPDRVATLLDAGHDVPVEALSSERVLERLEDQAKQRAAPVHAEDLVAVPKGHPVTQIRHDGVSVPRMPVTRRVIPRPFQRPRIDISHHGKTWQRKPVSEVRPGDMVPDVGRVALEPERRTCYLQRFHFFPADYDFGLHGHDPNEMISVGLKLVLTGIDGREHFYAEDDWTRVFTEQGAEPEQADAARAEPARDTV